MGKTGYHLSKTDLLNQIDSYFIVCGVKINQEYYPVSDKTLSRMLQRNTLATATTTKIDVARVKQHTPQVQDCMFKIFDNATQRLHKTQPEFFPWPCLSRVPPLHIFNADEVCVFLFLFFFSFMFCLFVLV